MSACSHLHEWSLPVYALYLKKNIYMHTNGYYPIMFSQFIYDQIVCVLSGWVGDAFLARRPYISFIVVNIIVYLPVITFVFCWSKRLYHIMFAKTYSRRNSSAFSAFFCLIKLLTEYLSLKRSHFHIMFVAGSFTALSQTYKTSLFDKKSTTFSISTAVLRFQSSHEQSSSFIHISRMNVQYPGKLLTYIPLRGPTIFTSL